MRFLHKKRPRAPAVIIVSLIDVLLVVLIFLMVTTTAKKVEPSLKLNLPQSTQAAPGSGENKPFVILVVTNAPYFRIVDRGGERAVTLDTIQTELNAAAKTNATLKVSVRADRQAPFGEVVKLIDATKLAQVASLDFVTEKNARP